MANEYPHLELTFSNKQYDRVKSGGGSGSKSPRSKEDKKKFLDVQIQKFNQLAATLEEEKSKVSNHFNPNLIFKISLNERGDEGGLETILNRMNFEVLSISPDESGAWVIFSEDKDLTEFKKKLQEYADESKKHDFFNLFEGINDIPINEKIGARLLENPIATDNFEYLDIEVWRMEDVHLNNFLEGLKSLLKENTQSRISDSLVTSDFCLLRVKINAETLQQILRFKEIAFVDRLPKPFISRKMLFSALEDLPIPTPPSEDAPNVVILDSGITANHPLFQNAIGDEVSFLENENLLDEVGHGTMVAGIILYGDVKLSLEKEELSQEIRILSGKILRTEDNDGVKSAIYDEEKLLENQLKNAVEYFLENYQNCRIFNLSIGNVHKKMFSGRRQFNLAALIDWLSKEYDIVFVISAGNFSEYFEYGFPEEYPSYLLNDDSDLTKILDPASAALAITVGSLAQDFGPEQIFPQDIISSPALSHFPSPFTRIGLGLNGMIKPDLVETGGNDFVDSQGRRNNDIGKKLLSLNNSFLVDNRLFALDVGTSLSAPKVAHYLGRLSKAYPNTSVNFLKALLISSSSIPKIRPTPLDEIELKTGTKADDLKNLFKVYGFGKPNIDKALFSSNQHIVLNADNNIKLDSAHIYSFFLPDDFILLKANKSISVTLIFNPPTKKTRREYLGCQMEFHLFKNETPEDLARIYKGIKIDDEETIPENLVTNEIKLFPGVRLRNLSPHQKGIKQMKIKMQNVDLEKPFTLVVICKNKWVNDADYQQDYSVIVSIDNETELEMYAKVRAKNKVQQRVRIGRTSTQ